MKKPLNFTTFAVYEFQGVDQIVACLDVQSAILTLQQMHDAPRSAVINLGYVDVVNQLVCVSDLYPFPADQDKTLAMLEVALRIAAAVKRDFTNAGRTT